MSLRFLIYFIFYFMISDLQSQNGIKIELLDEHHTPISGATVKRFNQNHFLLSDSNGIVNWQLDNGIDTIIINHLGFKERVQIVSADIILFLEPLITELPAPQIISSWVNKNSFVVNTTWNVKQIEKKQSVQDIPLLLQNLPSTVSSSDAGNGIGYTGIRIRGLDPTQINVLINGVPLNDAESQSVFWVDLPDLIASASEIQVQRGIGMSGSGQVAFGSSILINTNKFNENPYLNFETGVGSFNTFKANVEAGTGFLKGNWNITGRLSAITSNGFIDRAKASLYSGNISISNMSSNRMIRMHLFDGLEKTYQAWYGAPIQYIQKGIRTYNAAGTEKKDSPYENQIDHYRQTHFQFLHSEILSKTVSIQNTIHFTPGAGYYEEYKSNQNPEQYLLPAGDLISIVRRRHLDNVYFGSIHTMDINTVKNKIQIGFSWNQYSGKHFGKIMQQGEIKLTSSPNYYDTDATKKSSMIFGKSEFKVRNFSFMADLQYRNINYVYIPDGSGTKQTVNHHFFNPKIGISYQPRHNIQFFGFSGLAHREPNRDDYTRAGRALPLAEKLWDNEIGIRKSTSRYSFEQNFYYMKYRNQLIPTGKLNDVGSYIRSNVRDSYRLGSETTLFLSPTNRTNFEFNLTVARNKTKIVEEYIDNWDQGNQEIRLHYNKNIAFSPTKIMNITAAYGILEKKLHKLTIDFAYQSISKQYLDGTQNPASALKSYSVVNGGLLYTFIKKGTPHLDIKFSCLNLMDFAYESNGWIYRFNSPSYNPVPDDPYAQTEKGSIYSLKGLFPQAGRNFVLTAKWRISPNKPF